MRVYRADLHIHSVLSPCGSLRMGPHALAQSASKAQLDIIAITDHNSMGNSRVYAEVARDYGIICLMGVEIQTAEEIHIIALFDDSPLVDVFNKKLYNSLLPIKNDPDYFGDQVFVDVHENIIGFEPRALINSSTWNYEETLLEIEQHNGFAFPAHVDAGTYSAIGQLGFLPAYPPIFAIGVSAVCDISHLRTICPYVQKLKCIRNSDAHYLEDIGKGCTFFHLNSPTVKEISRVCHTNTNGMVIPSNPYDPNR